MVLANARLSERSRAKGERLRALMRPAAARFTRVLAQTEDDARRLRESGARAVQVMGNLKFDITPPPALLARGRQWRQALGRAGGAGRQHARRRGGAAAARLARRCPGRGRCCCWCRATRSASTRSARMVAAAGLRGLRRSGWADAPPAAAAAADVWLGDSLGEMPLYYALADVALLGGSFAPLGGQNLIEAAACGCPLVMGPHTFNFAQAAEMSLAAGAARRVADIDEGVRCAVGLAGDASREAASRKALAFAAQHRGAAERMAAVIAALLPPDCTATLTRRRLRQQQAVDAVDVGQRKLTRGLAQAQVADQHVVARLGQVALGGEERGLRVEHVEVDAHADLVAELRGLERELGRRLGRFQRLHLRQQGLHAVVGDARIERHAAPGRLQVVARLLLQRQGFLDAVLRQAAGVEAAS